MRNDAPIDGRVVLLYATVPVSNAVQETTPDVTVLPAQLGV